MRLNILRNLTPTYPHADGEAFFWPGCCLLTVCYPGSAVFALLWCSLLWCSLLFAPGPLFCLLVSWFVRACPFIVLSCLVLYPLISTFPGTEMPPIGHYSPGAICPQLGGSCSKLAFWLQVRGTMCSEPDWKPQFVGQLSAESESAAYEATLDRHNVCKHQKKENEEYTRTLQTTMRGQCFFLFYFSFFFLFLYSFLNRYNRLCVLCVCFVFFPLFLYS